MPGANRPSFEEQVREYLQPVAGSFAYEGMVENHLDIEKYRPWAEVINHYHPIDGADVFSSGCGSAGDLQVMHEKGAASVSGIEVEEKLAELARTRLRDAGVASFDISTYPGRELPYRDASFDIITSIHVVEHVGHVRAYLSELLRVLKPGGILFLDCPNRFYPIEQHTGLRYVHLLPNVIRDLLMRVIVRGRPPVGVSPLRDKCGALIGMKPPFAAQIMRCMKAKQEHYPHRIEDAFFHDFNQFHHPYGKKRLLNARAIYHHAPAFRLVASRSNR